MYLLYFTKAVQNSNIHSGEIILHIAPTGERFRIQKEFYPFVLKLLCRTTLETQTSMILILS